MNLLSKQSIVLQAAVTSASFVGGFVPLSMGIGILAWGGTDPFIIVFTGATALAMLALVPALIGVSSSNKFLVGIGLAGVATIGCVTLIYTSEFLFSRVDGTPLWATVPVFGANFPLLVLYGATLTVSCFDFVIRLVKMKQVKFPRSHNGNDHRTTY
jgi:hypothetical protein